MAEDVPQNPTTSPASDSDSDEAQQKALQTLETALSSNPSYYDAHVQYIKLLRKMGELEKLRQAREAMSEIFPLAPYMWQEWAKDEASLITCLHGSEAVNEIKKLYERGVFDYVSVSLWCEYLNFVQEYDPMVRDHSPTAISEARILFERALDAAGLHLAQGIKLWEAYRTFEQAILLTISDSDVQEKEKQNQRIRTLFQRQLAIPHVDLKSTLQAYKAWEVEQGKVLDVESSELDGISSQVASDYQEALERYNDRAHLEEQISRQDISYSEKLQQFGIYLKFEESSGDPAQVQALYERAITDFPIASDLWLDYTRYLDKTLKFGKVVREVYSRATKNCPWVGELWVRYLLCLERSRASKEELAAVFEKSSRCTFSTIDEYLDLFLTRVDGLRRRFSLTNEVSDYLIIRETFKNASDYFSLYLKNTEGLVRFHNYWACIEQNLGNDLDAACGVRESLLKIWFDHIFSLPYFEDRTLLFDFSVTSFQVCRQIAACFCSGSNWEAWKGYIARQIKLGRINEARSIYKRCYTRRFYGTGSEEVCHSWVRFEGEYGTLEDFDHAVEKVTRHLAALQPRTSLEV